MCCDFYNLRHYLLFVAFIKATQAEKYTGIEENYGADTNREIEKALKEELSGKKLWLKPGDSEVMCANLKNSRFKTLHQ